MLAFSLAGFRFWGLFVFFYFLSLFKIQGITWELTGQSVSQAWEIREVWFLFFFFFYFSTSLSPHLRTSLEIFWTRIWDDCGISLDCSCRIWGGEGLFSHTSTLSLKLERDRLLSPQIRKLNSSVGVICLFLTCQLKFLDTYAHLTLICFFFFSFLSLRL